MNWAAILSAAFKAAKSNQTLDVTEFRAIKKSKEKNSSSRSMSVVKLFCKVQLYRNRGRSILCLVSRASGI